VQVAICNTKGQEVPCSRHIATPTPEEKAQRGTSSESHVYVDLVANDPVYEAKRKYLKYGLGKDF
jgi:hypothetical protein